MRTLAWLSTVIFSLFLMACSNSSSESGQGCSGSCATSESKLSIADVEKIIAQAVAESLVRGENATITVVDRVGNVLAVFAMTDALDAVEISSQRGVVGGLEGINIIPASLASISKAVTGAYLSTEGNAFTTRTASQIIQEHFNPGELGQPGGPLFGVQFSNLACSDLNTRFSVSAGTGAGPKRSPLGFSADPGGMPLYKDGVPVGGVGIVVDALYGLDAVVTDDDFNVDEAVAWAASSGYRAPEDRQGDRITVDGKLLRYVNNASTELMSDPEQAASFDAIDGVQGNLQAVTGYFDGVALEGLSFADPSSGFQSEDTVFSGLDAFVLVDDGGAERFAPRAGVTLAGDELTAVEVTTLLREALKVANDARAQIRRPTGSAARVSVSVVDHAGNVLGIVRSRDAPIFGIDVSLQKARTATFFSSTSAAASLSSAPDAIYLNADASASGQVSVIGDYVTAAQDFLGDASALANGTAFADRSGGNLSRPFYPDGIPGNNPGPFSKAWTDWSPFSNGLQLDLVMNQIITHVVFVLGGGADVTQNCSTLSELANGMQIFPGSVPIYRGDTLVGGIGVSGDGIEQDDMISFLGLHNAGELLNTGIQNADPANRADQLAPQGVNLRYVACPIAPFLNSGEQYVCEGK